MFLSLPLSGEKKLHTVIDDCYQIDYEAVSSAIDEVLVHALYESGIPHCSVLNYDTESIRQTGPSVGLSLTLTS